MGNIMGTKPNGGARDYEDSVADEEAQEALRSVGLGVGRDTDIAESAVSVTRQTDRMVQVVDDMLIEARSEYQAAHGDGIMRAGGKMDALFDVRAAIDQILLPND